MKDRDRWRNKCISEKTELNAKINCELADDLQACAGLIIKLANGNIEQMRVYVKLRHKLQQSKYQKSTNNSRENKAQFSVKSSPVFFMLLQKQRIMCAQTHVNFTGECTHNTYSTYLTLVGTRAEFTALMASSKFSSSSGTPSLLTKIPDIAEDIGQNTVVVTLI